MTYTGTPASSIPAKIAARASWLSLAPLKLKSPVIITASGRSAAHWAAKARTRGSILSMTFPSASVTSSVKASPLSVSEGAI